MLRRVIDNICTAISKFEAQKKKVILGDSCKINGICKFLSDSPGSIKIGNKVDINSGRRFNPIGGDTYTMFRTIGVGKIVIGNNVGISNSTIVARKAVRIEDKVRIGGSCKIYDNDFHSLGVKNRLSSSDTNIASSEIIIKEGAFIGAHSIILKGVVIGINSIIGAGSVVTKNVPDGEIWGGNPAKFIRKIND